mmetsp:Transcript_57743/g.161010  ORF Transcript_57743/g.161010 Transcript_57743/m.161010 type:complete len:751 (+) Transcript_57743:65-2317(+)
MALFHFFISSLLWLSAATGALGRLGAFPGVIAVREAFLRAETWTAASASAKAQTPGVAPAEARQGDDTPPLEPRHESLREPRPEPLPEPSREPLRELSRQPSQEHPEPPHEESQRMQQGVRSDTWVGWPQAPREDLMVRNEDIRPPFTYEHSLNFVLVVPKYRLLFCYVPKNACSQFNSIFNEMNGVPESDVQPWFGSSALRAFGWSKQQVAETIRSQQWYKAVFLRDPLERILSGYLSKCLPNKDGTAEDFGEHCLGFEDAVRRGEAPTFHEFLGRLETLDNTRQGLLDAHFRPQSDFCGGLNMSDYDFVGSFQHDLNPQVKNLLRAVGAGAELDLADKYFPVSGQQRTAEENRLTKASSPAVFNQHYSTTADMLRGYHIYRNDYQHFPTLRRTASKICITCLYALDFEKRRSLDWMAYHNLLGVDCFVLFLDRRRSNMDDPDVKRVHHHLLASPMVTLLDAETDDSRIPSSPVMDSLSTLLGIRYLMTIDGDEFAVLDEDSAKASPESLAPSSAKDFDSQFVGSLMGALPSSDVASLPAMQSPPDLRSYLEKTVSQTGALGVYMHRWDYGTSGYVHPPSLLGMPEFAVLSERRGDTKRKGVIDRHGKVILNLPTGVKFIGVHTWTVPRSGGQMLLPNGTAFKCKPECICGSLCHGTGDMSPKCDAICKPSTPQKLFINHYVTGSLEECFDRKKRSVWDRRSYDECRRMHPGTTAYKLLQLEGGFVKDDVMAKYAAAVRVRRVELFLAQ